MPGEGSILDDAPKFSYWHGRLSSSRAGYNGGLAENRAGRGIEPEEDKG